MHVLIQVSLNISLFYLTCVFDSSYLHAYLHEQKTQNICIWWNRLIASVFYETCYTPIITCRCCKPYMGAYCNHLPAPVPRGPAGRRRRYDDRGVHECGTENDSDSRGPTHSVVNVLRYQYRNSHCCDKTFLSPQWRSCNKTKTIIKNKEKNIETYTCTKMTDTLQTTDTYTLLNDKFYNLISISPKFVSDGPIDNEPTPI